MDAEMEANNYFGFKISGLRLFHWGLLGPTYGAPWAIAAN